MIPTVAKGQVNQELLKAQKITFAELYDKAISLPLDKFLDSMPEQKNRGDWILAAVEAWEDRGTYQTVRSAVNE